MKKKRENPDVLRNIAEISTTTSKQMVGSYFAGTRMQHSYMAIYVLENVLNIYQPAKIVEFGARWGGTTSFLGVWAVANNKQFLSVDRTSDLRETSQRLLKQLSSNVNLQYMNVFSPECFEYIKNWLKEEKCLIYCDNGDKLRELEIYSELLQPGSIIACHDYTTAVQESAVKDMIVTKNLKPLLTNKQVEDLASRQQFWMKQ